jgi:creatinine amidohydrolase
LGSVEAHGPHLPLATDTLLARDLCDAVRLDLTVQGKDHVVILPEVIYTPVECAQNFSGSVHIAPDPFRLYLIQILLAIRRWPIQRVVIVSVHLDPACLAAIRGAVEEAQRESGPPIAFPDLTQKPLALQLTAEFQHGGPHAGHFETALMLHSDRVNETKEVKRDLQRRLKKVDVNLGELIRQGKRDFKEMGGTEGYFGDPASATEDDGEEIFDVLTRIFVEAALGKSPAE